LIFRPLKTASSSLEIAVIRSSASRAEDNGNIIERGLQAGAFQFQLADQAGQLLCRLFAAGS
jgi:hypothetical protein